MTARRATLPAVLLASLCLTAAPATAQEAAPKEPPPRIIEFLDADTIRDGEQIVRFYRVNSVDPKVLIAELKNWQSPKAKIAAVGAQFPVTKGVAIQNVLRIQTDEENWLILERVLEMIDKPQPQVYVEAKVVELTYDDELRLGIEASNIRTDNPVGDLFFQRADLSFPNLLEGGDDFTKLTFGSADKFVKFDYVLQLADRGAQAEVLTQPAIMASQGQLATIKVGDQEPIVKQTVSGNNISATTDFKDVGVTLNVTPLLIGRDFIRAKLEPEVSRVSEFRVTSTSTERAVINPVISTRTATTVAEVPDGETIVISGLVQTIDGDTSTGIPFLKDIPVAGRLFGSTTSRRQKTEIVFFVTLSIVRPGDARLIVPPGERERTESDGGDGTAYDKR